MADKLRPEQMEVTTGTSNNDTVPTFGKVEDMIGDAGANGIFDLTSAEVSQLANIGTETISAGQWGYLGALDQSLTTGSHVGFESVTVDGLLINDNAIKSVSTSLTIETQGSDDIFITANSSNYLNLSGGGIAFYPTSGGGYVVMNEDGGDADFRVEGTSDENLIFADASEDKVGIGTATPSVKLDVNGAGKFTSLTVDNLLIDGNTISSTSGDVNITSIADINIKSTLATGKISWLKDTGLPALAYDNNTDKFTFFDDIDVAIGGEIAVNTINNNGSIFGVTIEGVQLLSDNLKADKIQGLTSATSIDIDKLTIDTTSAAFTTISSSDVTNGLILDGGASSAIFRLDRGATNQSGTLEFHTASVGKWTVGLIANEGDDYLIKSAGTAGDIELISGTTTGNVVINPGSSGLLKLNGNITTADVAPTDLDITCGANKTIELQNTVWEDLRIVPGAFQFLGGDDPTLSAWQPGASGATFQIYKFQSSDEVYFTCQLPHAYKQGTDVKAHVHWTPADRGNEESGKTVAWKLDYSWSNIAGTFASSATADMTDTCTGTDDYHEMTSSVTITGTGKNISSMLVCRLYRDTGDDWVGTTAAQSPGLLEFDLHYEINTVGSREEAVK